MSDTLLINNILAKASERKATDVHLVAGSSPVIRVDGRLVTLTEDPIMTPDTLSNIAASFLTQEGMEELTREKEIVTVYTWANRARFRIRVFYQKGFIALSLRWIPPFIRSPKDLGVPAAIIQLLNAENGLLIVTGPFASGRTTTAASLIETINQNRGHHIQTLEKPIEYLFTNDQSVIEQREVGRDVSSFKKGLHDIIDEDVDVLYLGAMYEQGIEEIVLRLAEGGKLVIAIMDAENVVSALERFVTNVAPEKRGWAQDLLSEVLIGITAQRLLPRVGGGLSLVSEVLTMTSAVRSSIKENKYGQLANIMQTSREEGMINMEKALQDLVRVGEISQKDADALTGSAQNQKQGYR